VRAKVEVINARVSAVVSTERLTFLSLGQRRAYPAPARWKFSDRTRVRAPVTYIQKIDMR
jgi:hypothetical protein